MYRAGQVRPPLLIAATIPFVIFGSLRMASAVPTRSLSQNKLESVQAQGATAHLSWPLRAGVSRYRLQLAHDAGFTDIVLDLVVNGNSYDVKDLPAGKYFWRIAGLTSRLSGFSVPAIVTVTEQKEPDSSVRIRPQTGKPSIMAQPTGKSTATAAAETTSTKPAPYLIAGGGWQAAIGDVQHPVLAHLRTPNWLDIVGISGTGVTSALDAITGSPLWSSPLPQKNGARLPLETSFEPLLLPGPSNVDSIITVLGSTVRRLNGINGAEIWRAELPTSAAGGIVWNDNRAPTVLVLDTSLRALMVLNAKDGALLSKTDLPGGVVGLPILCDYQNKLAVALAYENGRVEVRDRVARLVRAGDTNSVNTTAPLFVNTAQTVLILVGTKTGITILDINALHPIAWITLGEAPRGTLAVADLDGDRNPEVIIVTERGRVVVVHPSDGKIVWESGAVEAAQSLSFADVNRDGVVDILVNGRQTFAAALSGRDGSVLWSQEQPASTVVDRPAALGAQAILNVPLKSATLVIASDAPYRGLRAVELRKAPDKR